MLNVILALIPCTIMGVKAFGFSAILLIAASVLSAVLGEMAWQRLTGQKVRIGDCSAAVTGLILGLNLSPRAPWWMAVVGGLFAVIIVKGLFGGIGCNFVNPALAARALLLVSWPRYMTIWSAPAGVEGLSSATPLASPDSYTIGQLFLGNIPGSIGEICKPAILIGLVILLLTKTITWQIPASLIASTFVFCGLLGANPLAAIFSGGVLFGAVFMATDYATCPMTEKGQLIYGCGAGLLIALIRRFGLYPEGVTFAILLMNVAAPLIDKCVPRRVYGHEKEAKA